MSVVRDTSPGAEGIGPYSWAGSWVGLHFAFRRKDECLPRAGRLPDRRGDCHDVDLAACVRRRREAGDRPLMRNDGGARESFAAVRVRGE